MQNDTSTSTSGSSSEYDTDLESEVNSLQEAYKLLNDSHKLLNDTHSKTSQQLESLRRENTSLRTVNDSLKKQNETTMKENEVIKRRDERNHLALSKHLITHSCVLESLKYFENANKELKENIVVLENENAKFNTKITELDGLKISVENKFDVLATERVQLYKKIKTLEDRLLKQDNSIKMIHLNKQKDKSFYDAKTGLGYEIPTHHATVSKTLPNLYNYEHMGIGYVPRSLEITEEDIKEAEEHRSEERRADNKRFKGIKFMEQSFEYSDLNESYNKEQSVTTEPSVSCDHNVVQETVHSNSSQPAEYVPTKLLKEKISYLQNTLSEKQKEIQDLNQQLESKHVFLENTNSYLPQIASLQKNVQNLLTENELLRKQCIAFGKGILETPDVEIVGSTKPKVSTTSNFPSHDLKKPTISVAPNSQRVNHNRQKRNNHFSDLKTKTTFASANRSVGNKQNVVNHAPSTSFNSDVSRFAKLNEKASFARARNSKSQKSKPIAKQAWQNTKALRKSQTNKPPQFVWLTKEQNAARKDEQIRLLKQKLENERKRSESIQLQKHRELQRWKQAKYNAFVHQKSRAPRSNKQQNAHKHKSSEILTPSHTKARGNVCANRNGPTHTWVPKEIPVLQEAVPTERWVPKTKAQSTSTLIQTDTSTEVELPEALKQFDAFLASHPEV